LIPALDEAENIERAIESALASGSEPRERMGRPGALERLARGAAACDGGADRASGDGESAGIERVGSGGVTRGVEGVEVDVIVVDGGSCDDTRARAERAGARVISSPRGRARQLQVGLHASAGSFGDNEVVLFLHADTCLPRGWTEAVRTALERPGVVGGAFRLRFDEHRWVARVVERTVRLRIALFALPFGDQALFARRSVLDEIGGIPDVPVMEDVDLVRAMKQRGRLALLAMPVTTSARRYREQGWLRTVGQHWLAMQAWRIGVDRQRVASWLGR